MKIFKKKMTLIADVVPKLRTRKTWLNKKPKKSRFRGPFGKQHGKGNETLLKLERHQLSQIYHCEGNSNGKTVS